MNKLFIIFLFMLTLFASSTYADNITEGTLFFPDSMNFTYNVSTNFSCNNITVNDTCVIIVGGTFDGTYCFNLTYLRLSDVILFPDASPISALTTIENEELLINVNFDWKNKTDSILKSGLTICEESTICLVDTLSGSLIKNVGDEIRNVITINDSFFDFQAESEAKEVNSLGVCDASNQFELVNISYFNEINNESINVSNTYNITFFDGFGNQNLQGDFIGNFSDIICTSVDPNIEVVNLLMYGRFILSKDGFVTRVTDIPQAAGTVVSNFPVGFKKLFLTEIANSTTLTYTWQTTNFEFIDGTMLIYTCDENNSRTLIHSVNIAGGTTTANLQLLTQAYSYEVVVNNQIFRDSSFTDCRVESTTEHTFFVDVAEVDVLPVLGLFLIDCSLENLSSTTVRMTWEANTEDDSEIEGCIIGRRETILGIQEVSRDCLNASAGQFTRSVPNIGNTYYISGELTQGGNKGYCQDVITLFEDNTTLDTIGINGPFAIGLIILSMSLLFAGDGIASIFGAIIGIILAFAIGIFGLPWNLMMDLITFLFSMALIGRHTRKRK